MKQTQNATKVTKPLPAEASKAQQHKNGCWVGFGPWRSRWHKILNVISSVCVCVAQNAAVRSDTCMQHVVVCIDSLHARCVASKQAAIKAGMRATVAGEGGAREATQAKYRVQAIRPTKQ